jgi:hypothetical protein
VHEEGPATGQLDHAVKLFLLGPTQNSLFVPTLQVPAYAFHAALPNTKCKLLLKYRRHDVIKISA